jgi:ATP-dependent protease ClpP protease subunit
MGEFCHIEDYIHKIYVEKTGQSYDIIQQDLTRTRLMLAKEARHYGIIDRIMTVDDILLLEENLVPVCIEFTSLFIN